VSLLTLAALVTYLPAAARRRSITARIDSDRPSAAKTIGFQIVR
jgi:hypothetical protein